VPRALVAVAAALALASALPPAVADSGGVPVVVITGRGFGHGVGLSQDGAYWMGRAGYGTLQILGQFFPGTSLATAGGQMRVLVDTAAGSGSGAQTVVSFPDGGQVQDALSGQQSPGFPVRVPAGGAATISWSAGRYRVSVSGGGSAAPGSAEWTAARIAAPSVSVPTSSTTTTTSPSITVPSSTTTTTSPHPTVPATPTTTTTATTVPPSTTSTTTGAPPPGGGPTSGRPLWAVPDNSSVVGVTATGRTYRGVLETVANTGATTSLDVVNQLDVEQYLRGMGEVQNPSWPLTSLQAQVIVERTYALRAMAAAGEICADTRCQVYLGTQGEYSAQDRAVSSTRGYVLAWNGALAATVFSANGGGFSASPQEGFGTSDAGYPYLRAAPYLTHDPMPWNLTVALSDVAARLGYSGPVSDVHVTATGPSGRATAVTVDGASGSLTVTGIAFAAALGLKSTLFQLSGGVSATAPPPPPPAAPPTQALPSDGPAISRAVTSPAPNVSPFGALDAGPAGGTGHRQPWSGPWQLTALALALAVEGLTTATVVRRRDEVLFVLRRM